MPDLSTNFILKNSKDITVNGEDVKRIKMFSDIVWEKHISTTTTLSASSSTVEYGDTFTLKATVTAVDNQLLNNVTVIFYDMTSTPTEIATVQGNNGVATCIIETKNAGINKYKAVYQKNDIYDDSESQCTVTVNKKETEIKVFGNNPYNAQKQITIYRGYYAGIQLLDYKGNILANEKVTMVINGITYTRTTDDNGIAKIIIRLNSGEYTFTYCYDGNNMYKGVRIDQVYKVLDYKQTTLTLSEPSSIIGISDSARIAGSYQKWQKTSNDRYCCYEYNIANNEHNTNRTINTIYKEPHLLKIRYNISINNVRQVYLWYHTYAGPALTIDADGTPKHVMSAPTINLYINDNLEKTVIGNNISHQTGSGYYTDDSFTWDFDNINMSNITLEFDFPQLSGTIEGFLAIEQIDFKVGYIPTQEPFWE